jgi:hypothetical protein
MDEHDAESCAAVCAQHHASDEGEDDAKSGFRTAACSKLLQIKVSMMPNRVKPLSDDIMLHVEGRT